MDGCLKVFKGTKNICKEEGLGSIIAITVGDVLNKGRNFIIVATAEGLCHIYSIESGEVSLLKIIAKLRVPHNVSSMLVSDIDGDGANELVIGTTGHAVYIFDVISIPMSSSPSSSSSSLFSALSTPASLSSSPIPQHDSSSSSSSLLSSSLLEMSEKKTEVEWKLKLKKEFLFDGQIESLAAIPVESDKADTVLAVGILGESQEYSHLEYRTVIDDEIYPHVIEVNDLNKDDDNEKKKKEEEEKDKNNDENMHDHVQSQVQPQEHVDIDFHRKTEIVSLSKNSKNGCSMYVVSSFNGYVALQKHEGSKLSAPVTLWRKSIANVPLLTSVVTSVVKEESEYDNIVVCSWDGTTHIYDVDGNSLRFVFGHSIRAFAAGKYRIMEGEEPSTCFIYLTFHGKIVIYYNIKIQKMYTYSMVDMLEDKVVATYRSLVGNDSAVPSLKEKRLLIKFCMNASPEYLEEIKKEIISKKTNNSVVDKNGGGGNTVVNESVDSNSISGDL